MKFESFTVIPSTKETKLTEPYIEDDNLNYTDNLSVWNKFNNIFIENYNRTNDENKKANPDFVVSYIRFTDELQNFADKFELYQTKPVVVHNKIILKSYEVLCDRLEDFNISNNKILFKLYKKVYKYDNEYKYVIRYSLIEE